MKSSVAGLLTYAFALQTVSGQYTTPPSVTIAHGELQGTSTTVPGATAGVNKFLGIPFAQSPPERFSPPTSPKPWTTPLKVQNFTAACVQEFVYPKPAQQITKIVFNNPGGPPPPESEDCLYLNVYAPNTPPPAGGRAVMFWIFGGGFTFGTAMQQGYDGSTLAAKHDVIVVVPNYRTNIFGFPGAPAIPTREQNLGLLDQRQALTWVQQNIARFGGDAGKVTIFGESAGASSVDRLVASFPDNPPFRAAIMESGQSTFGDLSDDNASKNVASWNSLLKLLNYTGNASSTDAVSFARKANATLIKDLIEKNALHFGPIIDNYTTISDPISAYKNKRVAQVPLLEGTNSQEGKIFELGQQNLTQFLLSNFQNATQRDAVARVFPASDPNAAYEQISEIFTQLTFACPQSAHVSLAHQSGLKVWRYLYDAAFNNTNPLYSLNIDLGVFHSSEIGLVYGTYPQVNVTAQEYALSNYMQSAWTSFAKNPTGGPGWGEVGSYGGVDLATLGSNGTSGATLVRQAFADKGCEVIQRPVQGFSPGY